jgi:hypothetical protein
MQSPAQEYRASGNRTNARIRFCDRGIGSMPRTFPAGRSIPGKKTNEGRKIYEKASLDWIGDKRIGFCSGAAF